MKFRNSRNSILYFKFKELCFFFFFFFNLFRLHWVLVVGSRIFVAACGTYARSSSPTGDWTWAACIGSTESYPLDYQGSPCTLSLRLCVFLYCKASHNQFSRSALTNEGICDWKYLGSWIKEQKCHWHIQKHTCYYWNWKKKRLNKQQMMIASPSEVNTDVGRYYNTLKVTLF